MNARKQRLQAAAIETRWASQAFRDEKYNKAQAKRDITQGNYTLARMHNLEAKWDRQWGKKRMRIAAKYRR